MMHLNASIIDQRLSGLQEAIRARAAAAINVSDAGRLKSLAFVYLCVQNDLSASAQEHGAAYFAAARQDIKTALQALYGQRDISLQQPSATFRRGDLIQQLKQIKV